MGSKCLCACLDKHITDAEGSEALGQMESQTAVESTAFVRCSVGYCLTVG
jgi:hypothetical protein